MMHTEPKDTSKEVSTKLILLLAIGAMLWYASFLLQPDHIGHWLPYGMLLLAEAIGMSQLLGMWLTTLLRPDRPDPPQLARIRAALERVEWKDVPRDLVSVLVPVAGEPLAVLKPTLEAARDIRFPHRTVVLDDGHSEDVRTLARHLDVEYLRRPRRDGKKAGNVNYGLSHVRTEFFVILDCDYVADPRFLHETLPYLLADPQMAFVQTPQHYSNREGFVSGGSAEIQDIFYRHVQAGKNAFGAAFCVGTNVLLRRSAIDEIGGMYEASNSEDIWTSLLLHERGWTSYFLPKILASGLAPETIGDHFRQQFRWSRGGLEILFTHNPLLRRLTLDQKLQYLHTTMHYLGSISVLTYFLLPLLYVYVGLRPIQGHGGEWLAHFLPYYLLIYISTAQLLGKWPDWRSIVVAVSAFPAHLSALLSVLTGFNMRWSVTGVMKNRRDYVMAVSPHLLLLCLSMGGIPLALFAAQGDWLLSLQMSLWLCLNSMMLLSICKRAFPRFAEQADDVHSPSLASLPSYA